MIIYEVNLEIEKGTTTDFMKWLKTKHIKDMLSVDGFKNAKLHIDEGNEKTTHDVLCCHYYVESRELLEKYFQNEAKTMRQEGLDLFSGKFNANRRILKCDFEL
eukprot:gene9919-2241_t